MSRSVAIRLVMSLSKSEKRQFKLLAKKQSGNKDYLSLFDLIAQTTNLSEKAIEDRFRKLHPRSSIDNTAAYLVKVLTDSLIQSRIKDDIIFQALYGILRINVLNERNLHQEGFKELNRLQQIANHTEAKLVRLMLYRQRLNYYSDNNFPDLSESYLVETQMKARNVLKDIQNLHEHSSLYELLKHRLIYSEQSSSEEDRKQLNDFLLSEMRIINVRIKSNLESKKLHLLFQSYLFTQIGDHKSALNSVHELNRLFEKNTHLLKSMPLDYFSAIDGVLNSLRTAGHFENMNFYIERLKQLNNSVYPEYFGSIVQKTIAIYQLAMYIATGNLNAAISYMDDIDPCLLKDYSLVNEEKQIELFFYHALVYFQAKKFKQANKYIDAIMVLGEADEKYPIYKAARLLDIITQYELKDMEYIDHTIRSYKRSVKNRSKLFKTEELVFKVIKLNPDANNSVKNKIIGKPISSMIMTIEKDKNELQLLKYFDFVHWAKTKFKI